MQKLNNPRSEYGVQTLPNKPDVNARDENGMTLLMLAARNGHESKVLNLIGAGANVHAKDKLRQTALAYAFKNKHTLVACTLIGAGATITREMNVNAQDKDGNTALMIAAKSNDDGVLSYLLAANADTSKTNKNKMTALMLAAKAGNHRMVSSLMIPRSKDVVQENMNVLTALKLAIETGQDKVVEFFIEKNLVNTSFDEENEEENENDIHQDDLTFAFQKGYTKLAAVLIQNSITMTNDMNINAEDDVGNTALLYAFERGYIFAGYRLIAKNAAIPNIAYEPRMKDDLDNMLVMAVRFGDVFAVNALINAGADVNVRYGPKNDTLLMVAALPDEDDINDGENDSDYIGVIRALLANRTPDQVRELLEQENSDDDNAITLAFEQGYHDIVEVLEEYGAVLPARLAAHRVGAGLNDAQSTHEVSVHESVSCSILALASQYLPGLNDDARTALRVKRGDDKQQAQTIILEALQKDEVEVYIEERLGFILSFMSNLQESDYQFDEYNALKVQAGKRGMERVLDNPLMLKFKDGRSQVRMKLALALVWDGLWDKENPGLTELTHSEKAQIWVQAFYDMQRGYNLDEDGKETAPDEDDSYICIPGHFNKLVSALAGGRHPLVEIIVVTKALVRCRAQALMAEHYLKRVPIDDMLKYFSEIENTGKLPPKLWEDYLKEEVTQIVRDEYREFIEAGMISDAVMQKGIHEAKDFPLEGECIKKMLKPLTSKAELDARERRHILSRYGIDEVNQDDVTSGSPMQETRLHLESSKNAILNRAALNFSRSRVIANLRKRDEIEQQAGPSAKPSESSEASDSDDSREISSEVNMSVSVSDKQIALATAFRNLQFSEVIKLIGEGVTITPAMDIDAWRGRRFLTPLQYALMTNHRPAAHKLMAAGAIITREIYLSAIRFRHSGGDTVLMLAALEGDDAVVSRLIILGDPVDLKNNDGMTALMVATFKGHTSIVRALIEAKANVHLSNNKGTTALMYAFEHSHTHAAYLLIEAGAKISKGMDINVRDNLGNTALIWAFKEGSMKAAAILILNGAKIPKGIVLNARDGSGNTLLHWMAKVSELQSKKINMKGIDALLNNDMSVKNRALVNQENYSGITPIMNAFYNCNFSTVELLESHGAILPGYLAEYKRRDGQSSVHESVSRSLLALASRYIPNLSDRERMDLRVNSRTSYDRAKAIVGHILENRQIQDWTNARLSEMSKFIQAMNWEDGLLYQKMNAEKIRAAERAMIRVLGTSSILNFKDERSHVSMRLALALVWQGLWDSHNPTLMGLSSLDKEKIWMKAFYDMEFSINPRVPMYFNTLVSALENRHPLVEITAKNEEINKRKPDDVGYSEGSKRRRLG